MIFNTLGGNQVNLPLNPYKIKWKKASLSKFQTRIKDFFFKYYGGLDWYEEVPLVGADITRLRWDFVCIFEDLKGKQQKVFVECQGGHHVKLNPKFQKSIEDFDNQLLRDSLKLMFAAENSKFPVIQIFEDDEPVTIKWFESVYPKVLPRKSLTKPKK